MANPKGNEASLVKFKPKWNHAPTTVIRVPVALVDQIMDYAHSLDAGSNNSQAQLQVNREMLEAEAKKLTKKSELPQNWQLFIDRVLQLQSGIDA
jgi:hypothetical protein